MTVYHGSTVEVRDPAILRSDVGRDFGFAFYATDIREQAERWAIRRARFARKGGCANASAIVSVYEVDEGRVAQLRKMDFQTVSMEWLDMVVRCRTDLNYRHGFDVVMGKIANDTVGEVVSYVVAGVMPKELAIEKLRFQKINNQIAMCTPDALSCLKFIRAYSVEVRQ